MQANLIPAIKASALAKTYSPETEAHYEAIRAESERTGKSMNEVEFGRNFTDEEMESLAAGARIQAKVYGTRFRY